MTNEYCGTRTGYNKHYDAKEVPCDACKFAKNEYMKIWRKTTLKKLNPEYVQEQKSLASKRAMRWAKENPEKNAESQKKFRENHPEVSREHKRRRRARKHENGYEKYLEQQVLETYGVICHVCFEEIDLEAPRQVGLQGWQKGFHIDHLVPISKGGPDTLENVRPAHGICNLKKSHFYSDLD